MAATRERTSFLELELRQKLRQSACAAGGWGYRANAAQGAAEATALVALALADNGADASDRTAAGERSNVTDRSDSIACAKLAAEWLARMQRADGSMPTAVGEHAPGWTTSLAMLAWSAVDARSYAARISRGAEWLLSKRGRTMDVKLSEGQHDGTILGWPWIDGTSAWVEPTAYAVMALRAAGQTEHARTRDGIRMIRDRRLPDGGWNYGNSEVLGNTLRAFPETTGVALTALAGTPRDAIIESGLSFLRETLQRVRTPLALGWGLIGLAAWGAAPSQAESWCEEAIKAALARPANPQHEALLLLAWRAARSNRSPIMQSADDRQADRAPEYAPSARNTQTEHTPHE